MLPANNDNDILRNLKTEQQPSYTYEMRIDEERIIGYTDKLEAVKQAIFKILNTERYESPIYSRNYGVEFKALYGMPVNYCATEIERRVKDALMQDDRVLDVVDFKFSYPKKRVIAVTFTVITSVGSFEAEREVEV